MEQRTDMLSLLNMMIQPGFLVKEGRVTEVNASARRLLLEPGAEVDPLLLTGREEYAHFREGCLYLRLSLGDTGCGAAVIRTDSGDLFVLDPEPENSELCALSLAAQALRDPMSNAMIAADQLQSAQLNRGLHQLLRIINNMSDAMLYTTVSHQETRNLSGLFDEIFEKAQAQLAQAGLHLTYEGLQEDVYALADEAQLERAVLNILSNSAKFSPAGSSLTAKLSRRKTMLCLSIQDSGPGIGDDILDQIFHRYLRHPGIEDSRFGLGLGMVLIRAAAANHGGTVLIDRPGGTRITMTMALRRSSDAMLRSPILKVDYAGDRDHGLLEFSQVLPASMYEKK